MAVARRLPAGGSVFEFGGGGSSLWLLDRGARLTVVEHHRGWYEELRRILPSTVDLILCEPAPEGVVASDAESGRFFDEYVQAINAQRDDSLDLVIIDGRARVACGLAAMNKVKPGGMLLLDDSDRRRYGRLIDALATWERADFRGLKAGGGGVHQTSIWFRPAAATGG
jgi:hypothetical protein